MANSKKLTCLSCGAINAVPADRIAAAPKCGVCGDKLVTGKVKDADLATVQKATKNDGMPIIVDLWAPWCGPCRTMAPEFSKAALELKTDVRFAKVNTDDNPKATQRYNVRGIPTILLFKGGKEIARQSGVMRSAELVRWIRARTM